MALNMRIHDKKGMSGKKVIAAGDPRRISGHLAPTEPIPTQQLVAEKVSRFGKTTIIN